MPVEKDLKIARWLITKRYLNKEQAEQSLKLQERVAGEGKAISLLQAVHRLKILDLETLTRIQQELKAAPKTETPAAPLAEVASDRDLKPAASKVAAEGPPVAKTSPAHLCNRHVWGHPLPLARQARYPPAFGVWSHTCSLNGIQRLECRPCPTGKGKGLPYHLERQQRQHG